MEKPFFDAVASVVRGGILCIIGQPEQRTVGDKSRHSSSKGGRIWMYYGFCCHGEWSIIFCKGLKNLSFWPTDTRVGRNTGQVPT